MFSPIVSSGLMCTPGTGSNCRILRAEHRRRARLNSAASFGVHQSRSAPDASIVRPWSSKPWVSSWPITPPIAP